jgi:predicted DsbA family dithiol-disulfide isomerase
LKVDYEVAVEWRAFELHPEIPPAGMPMPPRIRASLGDTSNRVEQMASEAGLKMVMSDRIPNSRRALEASEHAREKGRHEAFHKAVFGKFYGEGEDLHSWAMLRSAALEVGLDPDVMQVETESGKYRAAVDAQIAEARALGITGVPTFIFNGRYAVVGAQPYAAFQEVMATLGMKPGKATDQIRGPVATP